MKFNLRTQREKFNFYVERLKDYDGIIELTKKFKPRTIQANKYLHVLIALYAINTGYTLDEMKIVLKRECYFMTYEKNGVKFLKKSSELNTKELSDWIEWIRNKAGMEGLYLPSAEDHHRNWEEIEQEIESNKQYL